MISVIGVSYGLLVALCLCGICTAPRELIQRDCIYFLRTLTPHYVIDIVIEDRKTVKGLKFQDGIDKSKVRRIGGTDRMIVKDCLKGEDESLTPPFVK